MHSKPYLATADLVASLTRSLHAVLLAVSDREGRDNAFQTIKGMYSERNNSFTAKVPNAFPEIR